MNNQILSAYISVKISREFNNEDTMLPLIKEWGGEDDPRNSITQDSTGTYGLKWNLVGETNNYFICDEKEWSKIKKRLGTIADEMNITLAQDSWKIQGAYWNEAVECPVIF